MICLLMMVNIFTNNISVAEAIWGAKETMNGPSNIDHLGHPGRNGKLLFLLLLAIQDHFIPQEHGKNCKDALII